MMKVINHLQVRDLRPLVFDAEGRMRVLPASFWQDTTVDERAVFGTRSGIYGFPTLELVERLRELIGARSAIEIGAGHGVLAEALGIVATDSFQQRDPKYRLVYELSQQAIVPYGASVVEMHASRAVRHYKPQAVVGCWVTHKYDPKQPERGGNEVGIDEPDILQHCESYIVVGNEEVHKHKVIWIRPHTIEYPPYLFSRATNGSRDFIAVFSGTTV
jgi:hypothetical protein